MHLLCVHICLCRVSGEYVLLIHVGAASPEMTEVIRISMKL